ncbi:hypothetical protein [uncultured Mucilaginibacter sp.]|uniref:hypothetical protein n=1 Tax=uncultured Mucilaginibacter sp. TaxID=797541 RepID=UPI0025FEFA6B|nr:hypothetical protein [uncultured Mucilaginibacter sp.]
MKKTIWLSITLIVILFTACKKDSGTTATSVTANNAYGAEVDNTIYFTITFNSKTITTYGVKFSNSAFASTVKSFLVGFSSTTTNSSNVIQTTLYIPTIQSTVWSVYGISPGQVNANIFLIKTGNAIGNYQLDAMGGTITDQTVGNKVYQISTTGLNFTVTTVDSNNIVGSFSCLLIDGTNSIPATGSFKIWKY